MQPSNGHEETAWDRLHRRVARLRLACEELAAESQREAERARSLIDSARRSRQTRWARRYEQARSRHEQALGETDFERR